MDKKQIRMELKLRERSFLESGAAAAESQRILSALEALPEFRNANCILAYMSIPGEVEQVPDHSAPEGERGEA